MFLFNTLLEVPVTTIRHEKETNHIQFGKKEVKVSSYADDIILYMENSENCTQKLLELMNEFIKVARHKITYSLFWRMQMNPLLLQRGVSGRLWPVEGSVVL